MIKSLLGKQVYPKNIVIFFVNNGGTSSEDIEKLINFVRQKVYEKYQINLDLELKIIGEATKNA